MGLAFSLCPVGALNDNNRLVSDRASASRTNARAKRLSFVGWILSPERRGPLLVTPAIITLFVVNIFPLMWSFGLSFYEYKANRIAPPVFAGLANYRYVLTDPEIWVRFGNTAMIVVGSVALQLDRRLPACAAVRAGVPAAALSSDAGPLPDDAVAQRGRRVLQALL